MGGGSFDQTQARSSTNSGEYNPTEVQQYYNKINQLSGGRLMKFAHEGTAPTDYNSVAYKGVTPAQIRALGGLGASQKADLKSNYNDQLAKVGADASLDPFQKQRSSQLDTQDYNTQLGAINKENEANITGLAAGQAQTKFADSADQSMKDYQARLANNQLTSQDLLNLAQIYFGGKGQYSDGRSFSTHSAGSYQASSGGGG